MTTLLTLPCILLFQATASNFFEWENFQRIAAREPENLLSQGEAGVWTDPGSLLIPTLIDWPLWTDTRWYKLEVSVFLCTYGRAASGTAAVWGQGAVTSYSTSLISSFPSQKDLGRGETLFPCIQGCWWQGTWNSWNIKLVTVASRKRFVIFTWVL